MLIEIGSVVTELDLQTISLTHIKNAKKKKKKINKGKRETKKEGKNKKVAEGGEY